MSLPRVRSVVWDPADPDGSRLVLLKVIDEGPRPASGHSIAQAHFHYPKPVDLPTEVRSFLQPISSDFLTHNLDFDYDYWNAGVVDSLMLKKRALYSLR